MLIHVIYASQSLSPFSRAATDALLAKARRNNSSLGVTGMLLVTTDSFFQVLEGEADEVHAPEHRRLIGWATPGPRQTGRSEDSEGARSRR